MSENKESPPDDFEVIEKNGYYYFVRILKLFTIFLLCRFLILKYLRQCLIEISDKNPSDVGWFSHFYLDLSLDSLGLATLMMDIETKYNVEIPDDAMAELASIIDVAFYIIIKATPNPNKKRL